MNGKTTIAVYPATFDPITYGHVDIAERAAAIFDRLIVAVYDRPLKSLLFDADERVELVRLALAHLPNIEVRRYAGLTVNFARSCGAQVLVRGLRVLSDFEWEFQLALTNRNIDPSIDTVCLMASQEYSFLSSSVVKEVAMVGGIITDMVPPPVAEALARRLKDLGDDGDNHVRMVSLRD